MPDLVEYPTVVAGTFAAEFLDLPEEVLTTTMIHHQHWFPVTDEAGKLKPAFLAVTNIEVEHAGADQPQRRARADGAPARCAVLLERGSQDAARGSRSDGSTRSCSTRRSAATVRRPSGSSGSRGGSPWTRSASPAAGDHAALAGRLAKADLATEMVQEFTELQGTMGGIYARAEGQPDEVWKAIYYHYLPVGVEADAPPTRETLGAARRDVGGGLAGRQARHARRAVRCR